MERTIQLREEEARSHDRSKEPPRPYNRKKDYYATLSLDRNCSAAEVRRAFRRLSLRYHPDKNPGQHAVEEFRKVTDAHKALLQIFQATGTTGSLLERHNG